MASTPTRTAGMVVVVALSIALLLPTESAHANLNLSISPPLIVVGAYPASIALAPDGATLYVVNSNPFHNPRQASLSIIDTSSRAVIGTVWLGTGYSAEQVAVTPDGTRAYVANSFHVDVVDLGTGHVEIISAGPANVLMSGLVIASDGKHAYAAHSTASSRHCPRRLSPMRSVSRPMDRGSMSAPARMLTSLRLRRTH